MRRLHLIFALGASAGLLVDLLVGGPLAGARGRSRGVVLPELTGRGKGADPARAVDASKDATASRRRLRQQAERRYPMEVLSDGTRRYFAPGFYADVAPDGSVRFRPRRASFEARQTAVSFDLTDATERSRGKDPYVAAKLRFLRDTRVLRARLRRQARQRWRRRYFEQLPARLGRLWGRRDLTPARKRRLLFALWRECLEPGASPLQRQAQWARWRILRFIQRHLPKGSPHGYPAAELAALNRERPRGRPRFAPYRKLGRPPPLPPPPRPRAAPARRPRARAAPSAPARGERAAPSAPARGARAAPSAPARGERAAPRREPPRRPAPR
jgi:hypothetical protein